MRYYFTILAFLVVCSAISQRERTAEELAQEQRMKAEMALIDGEKHLILENYAKALEMFQAAKEINPNDAAIYFKIAEVLYRNEEYDKAIRSAEKAIDLSPENKFYYVLAADIHMGRSDLPSAQKTYEKLTQMPDTEEYLSELALIYEYQGKNKDALATYEKVQDHFGTNEGLVKQKSRLFELQRQPEKILEEWERLVKENPGQEEYVYTLADELIKANEVERAEEVLKNVLTKKPEDARAGLMLAEVMKRQGETVESMKYARASLLAPEVDFELKGRIMNDLLKSSKGEGREELGSLVQDVAAVHDDEYVAQAFAGDVLFQLDQKRKALDFYVKATRLSADNFSVWQNILSLESEFEMWDDLSTHSEEAMEYFPNQAALYYFGGTAYIKKQNFQRAATLLEMGKRYAVDDELRKAFDIQIANAKNGGTPQN